MSEIDQIQLNFNQHSLMAINIVIAIIMFGVALNTRPNDFKKVFKRPKSLMIGLVAKLIILPALTCLFTILFNIPSSLALGLILVASCPGGNVSNFLTHRSKGNTALSISMSSISTMLSIVMTPLNVTFWGNINPNTATILRIIKIDPFDILITVVTILIIPSILGMSIKSKYPNFSNSIKKPFNNFAILVFTAILIGAFVNNFEVFKTQIQNVFWLVLIINTLGLLTGYIMAKLFNLSLRDIKAITFETGIKNAAFGLILVFDFFNGLGGMAMVAAWWCIWHLVSGFTIAQVWKIKSEQSEIIPSKEKYGTE